MWRENSQGICNAVHKHLQSQKAYDMDTVLNNDNAKVKVSERTAQRWLAKPGWTYGRDKKGYSMGMKVVMLFSVHV